MIVIDRSTLVRTGAQASFDVYRYLGERIPVGSGLAVRMTTHMQVDCSSKSARLITSSAFGADNQQLYSGPIEGDLNEWHTNPDDAGTINSACHAPNPAKHLHWNGHAQLLLEYLRSTQP